MEIGKRIGAYLKDQGIKQAYLCERTGLTPTEMSYICTGKCKKVDAIDYYKICKALEVDLLYFLRNGDSEI
jgi:transcriptional regulator with XRE-family HTH domain